MTSKIQLSLQQEKTLKLYTPSVHVTHFAIGFSVLFSGHF